MYMNTKIVVSCSPSQPCSFETDMHSFGHSFMTKASHLFIHLIKRRHPVHSPIISTNHLCPQACRRCFMHALFIHSIFCLHLSCWESQNEPCATLCDTNRRSQVQLSNNWTCSFLDQYWTMRLCECLKLLRSYSRLVWETVLELWALCSSIAFVASWLFYS